MMGPTLVKLTLLIWDCNFTQKSYDDLYFYLQPSKTNVLRVHSSNALLFNLS